MSPSVIDGESTEERRREETTAEGSGPGNEKKSAGRPKSRQRSVGDDPKRTRLEVEDFRFSLGDQTKNEQLIHDVELLPHDLAGGSDPGGT